MPSLKFESVVLPKKNQILVTNSRSPLGQAIQAQLLPYSHVEVLTRSDSEIDQSDVTSLSAIIHLVGFASTSLADTLNHTVVLYQLLQLARSYEAKFLLVLPNSHTHLYHTSLTMLSQYAKNFPLSYQAVEINPDVSPTTSAYEIVKKIIHRHKAPLDRPTPPPPPLVHTQLVKKTFKLPHPQLKFTLPHLGFRLPSISFPSVKFHFRPQAGLVVLLFLFSPWLISLFLLLGMTLSLKCVQSSLASQHLDTAITCSKSSQFFSSSVTKLHPIAPGISALSARLNFPLPEVNAVTHSLSSSLVNLTSAQSHGVNFLSDLIAGRSHTKNATLFNQSLSLSTENLAQLQTDLRAWYQVLRTPPSYLNQAARQLSLTKDLTNKLQSVAQNYNTYFPVDGDVTYAILLQDNLELKPTGGYLDTVIIAPFSQGQLGDLEVITSATLDSRLNGTVSAPTDYKSVVGESNWFLRDSNWDVDFPTTARQSAWFLERELGRPVDGLIALNLTTLGHLLDASEPVTYNGKRITSQNLRQEYLSHLESRPQSDSFIYYLAHSLSSQLKTLSLSQLQHLARLALMDLSQRQILIQPLTFSAPALDSAGWSGGVNSPGCRSQLPCLADYLLATDTNLSANKADAFISKTALLDVEIRPEAIIRQYSFTYQNRSTQSVWPSGDYKNYFRLYVPANSQVESIKLNGTLLTKSQYAITDAHNLKLISVLLLVPPGQSHIVEVKTQSPTQIKSQFHYQLDLVNQPGQSPQPLTLNLIYPKEWFATIYSDRSTANPAVASPGLIRYNTDLSKGLIIDLDLAPPSL